MLHQRKKSSSIEQLSSSLVDPESLADDPQGKTHVRNRNWWRRLRWKVFIPLVTVLLLTVYVLGRAGYLFSVYGTWQLFRFRTSRNITFPLHDNDLACMRETEALFTANQDLKCVSAVAASCYIRYMCVRSSQPVCMVNPTWTNDHGAKQETHLETSAAYCGHSNEVPRVRWDKIVVQYQDRYTGQPAAIKLRSQAVCVQQQHDILDGKLPCH